MSADKVIAKLRALPETWAKATPDGRVELLNSIYERIIVKGCEFVARGGRKLVNRTVVP